MFSRSDSGDQVRTDHTNSLKWVVSATGCKVSGKSIKRTDHQGFCQEWSLCSDQSCTIPFPKGKLFSFITVSNDTWPSLICELNDTPHKTCFLHSCFLAQDTEGINQSLETLCLSMTEHALSGKVIGKHVHEDMSI